MQRTITIERPIAEGLAAAARFDATLPESFMWGRDGAMRTHTLHVSRESQGTAGVEQRLAP